VAEAETARKMLTYLFTNARSKSHLNWSLIRNNRLMRSLRSTIFLIKLLLTQQYQRRQCLQPLPPPPGHPLLKDQAVLRRQNSKTLQQNSSQLRVQKVKTSSGKCLLTTMLTSKNVSHSHLCTEYGKTTSNFCSSATFLQTNFSVL
jgi:hypothetical protein